METITLNNQSYLVDHQLADFTIFQKISSNVDFFGTDQANNKLFVQFKGGFGAYIYSGVPTELLNEAENAESIGKFIYTSIVRKYETEKFEIRLIKPVLNTNATQPTF